MSSLKIFTEPICRLLSLSTFAAKQNLNLLVRPRSDVYPSGVILHEYGYCSL